MSCKAYKKALTEAAANGLEPQAGLQIHLRECSACHAEFTEAQTLFAAIDNGIGASVSEQPSANFLTLVRTSVLAQQVVGSFWFRHFSWRPWILAAGAILIAVATIADHRDMKEVKSISQVGITYQDVLAHQNAVAVPAQDIHKFVKRKQNEKVIKQVPDAKSGQEEVIFSAEEQNNYRALVSTLQLKTNRSVVVPLAPLSSENKPLEFRPVQIASLEIYPLVRGDN